VSGRRRATEGAGQEGEEKPGSPSHPPQVRGQAPRVPKKIAEG
jgi:hypothetical protein